MHLSLSHTLKQLVKSTSYLFAPTVVKLTINFSVGRTPIISRTEQNMTKTSFVHFINYILYKP